jgi:hypothetical protein
MPSTRDDWRQKTMSETSETPLATQTAAPPTVPPKHPIVGIAMGDDDLSRLRARFEEQGRQLAALRDDIDRMIAERVQSRERRRAMDPPDA